MRKTMKDVSTAPTMNTKIATNQMNWAKILEMPTVKMLSLMEAIPIPIREVNNRRKSVEATLSVRQTATRLV
jgi:hypothetical protein